MTWVDEAIERLAAQPICGYQPEAPPAVEPTALTALALMAMGRGDRALPALDWLAGAQSADGSLGIDAGTREPCWPTGWAVLAWNTGIGKIAAAKTEWSAAAERAVAWLLATRGCRYEPVDEGLRLSRHDSALQGWAWVEGTHSWVEPTAISLLALDSAKLADHPHVREAVALLLDRQLPDGGWNYGNTIVLGHVLRPHAQPTGLALSALAPEREIRAKVIRSLNLLERTLSERTTTSSLCYALLGLSAYGLRPESANRWLSSAFQRARMHNSPYHLALLALATSKMDFYGPRE